MEIEIISGDMKSLRRPLDVIYLLAVFVAKKLKFFIIEPNELTKQKNKCERKC